MHEAVRTLLLLALAGCLVTAAGSGATWWRDEERRLRRYLRKALGAPPESMIVAPGRGRAAGLSLERGLVAVLWDGGTKGLIYRLRQLVGAELILDDAVAARVFRGEARRALDQAPSVAHQVILRLIFDNPRDPDFELELWPPGDAAKRERTSVGQAIAGGRRWISGVEAILRQAEPAVGRARASEPEAEDEPLPRAAYSAPPAEPQERPPWDEDEDEIE
jgi:hypothetical protein